MFWNRKPNATPLGVPLGDLMTMLAPTTIKASLHDNALIADHGHYTVRVEVVPPEVRESENGPIRAVVRVVTELPAPLSPLFRGREAPATATFNTFAALGALYQGGRHGAHRLATDDLRGVNAHQEPPLFAHEVAVFTSSVLTAL